MYYIYFDESKFEKTDFVIGTFVFCKEDPSTFISQSLKEHGFDPNSDEYKSGLFFQRNNQMRRVRDKLKSYLYGNVLFGAVILPHSKVRYLGFEALKALRQFLAANSILGGNRIYFDEGIFESVAKAFEKIQILGIENNEFYLEQNSIQIKGIQLADLCSHSLTTMLRERMGDLTKMVKNPENSGYDPEESTNIGFDIWASIRYSFLADKNKPYIEGESQLSNLTFEVEPFGLFISDYCSVELAEKARGVFGTVYLGCIH
ncbi:MAG TPA: hypothetical protein VK543_01190 [Puia sp.]|nr:hypothetical protein [Puia sp.]